MRYLVTLMIAGVFVTANAAEPPSAIPLAPYLSAESVSKKWSPARSHLIALGALEKVNHVVQPEESLVFSGRRFHETYYLPEARRTEQVFEHYRGQLQEAGEILFQCDGRGCGSSSYWANKIFGEAILYGPVQFQKYAIARRIDDGGYIAVYVGQRGTREIYVHLVHFLVED